MKKLYFLATAAVFVLAGCTKSDSFDGGLLTKDLEISYDAFSGNASNTKVGFATGAIKDSLFQFASVAFYTDERDAWEQETWADKDSLGTQWLRYTDIHAVMSGSKNSRSIVSFKSNTKAYWPKKGYLNFFSWYPSTIKTEMYKGALKIADYTVVAAANQDLMVADPALGLFRTDADADYTPMSNGTAAADYSGVKTLFRHKLTKIGVEVKVDSLGDSNLEEFEVAILKVEIDTVVNKGTFRGDTLANKGYWKVDTTSRVSYNFPMLQGDTVKVVYPYNNAYPHYVSAVADQIMLMPQTRVEMGPDAVLKLTCDLKYKIKGQTNDIVEKGFVYRTTISDLEWKLNTTTNEYKWVEKSQQAGGPKYLGWGINNYIIYRLVLGLNEIEWAPEVMDWDEAQYVEPIYVE